MARFRSPVWEFFEKNGEKKVKCNLCESLLAYHGGTTAMQNHLSSRHPENIEPADKNQCRITSTFVSTKKCPKERAKEITLRWLLKISDQSALLMEWASRILWRTLSQVTYYHRTHTLPPFVKRKAQYCNCLL